MKHDSPEPHSEEPYSKGQGAGRERRARATVADQVRTLLPLLVLWAICAVVLGVLVLQDSVPQADLLLDPTTTGRLPWYTGLVSNLGVLAWALATAAAAGGAYISRLGQRDGAMAFLQGGALLSTLLLLDDLFQFHIVVHRTTPLPKTGVYVVYIALTLGWVATHRSEIARTRWQFLAAAGAAFAVSVTIDVATSKTTAALVAEDAAKFLGVMAWAAYFVHTALDIARSLIRPDEFVDASAPQLASASTVS